MKATGILILLLHFFTCGYTQGNGERVSVNGTQIFVAKEGQGEYLLFIHGGPGLNHAYFRPYVDQLSKKYTLLFYDQRACGRSAIPSSDSISLDFFVQDIDAIRKILGVEKINILAHSWGAIVATEYALAYPDNINKLIYSNPVPLSKEYDDEMNAFVKSHTSKKDSADRASILSSGKLDVHNIEKLMKINFRNSAYKSSNLNQLNLELPASFMESNRALFTGLASDLKAYNYYDMVSSFHFPVLILHGKYDGIPWSSVSRLQGKIPGASLKVFKKSGHFPFIEETKRFQKAIQNFIK